MNSDRYENAVTRYFEAWNARETEARAKAVAAAWTADGGYTDPFSEAGGHEQIAAVIAGTHEQFPGFAFRLAGCGGRASRHGALLLGTGERDGRLGARGGSDVIVLDADGRIKAVLGFLDRVPAGA